jgi:hypothetical protein
MGAPRPRASHPDRRCLSIPRYKRRTIHFSPFLGCPDHRFDRVRTVHATLNLEAFDAIYRPATTTNLNLYGTALTLAEYKS